MSLFEAEVRSILEGLRPERVYILYFDSVVHKVYELGGDKSYTLAELAAEVAQQTKKPVIYKEMSQGEYAAALVGFGLPEGLANALADADTGASHGALDTSSHDLRTLIGRATKPMQESVSAALPQ